MENYKTDFSKIKDKILSSFGERILNFTHIDMDGIGANIALSSYLPNVSRIDVNYGDIDERVKRFDLNDYSLVIFTDICPSGIFDYLSKYNNIIILDHHATALEFHNPDKNIFVYDGISGSKLTLEFMKTVFGNKRQFQEISELIEIINDYDLWIHADKRSKFFNMLYHKYHSDGFKNRFQTGCIKLLNSERAYIEDVSKSIRETFNSLEIFKFDETNGSMFFVVDHINDMCEMTMQKYDLDFVISTNPNTLKSSLRTNGKIDAGAILKSLNIGGGHVSAGGFKSENLEEFKVNVCNIEKKIIEHNKVPS